eukprot:scaffold2462_cov402-Prasinococcus_capsulatus_cf.AAC.28
MPIRSATAHQAIAQGRIANEGPEYLSDTGEERPQERPGTVARCVVHRDRHTETWKRAIQTQRLPGQSQQLPQRQGTRRPG